MRGPYPERSPNPRVRSVFHGEPAELRSVPGVWRGIGDGHTAAPIQLGLLLSSATPIARVAPAASLAGVHS